MTQQRWPADISTQFEIVPGKYYPRYSRIFIDEPRNLDLDLVYSVLGRDPNQLFIILGN